MNETPADSDFRPERKWPIRVFGFHERHRTLEQSMYSCCRLSMTGLLWKCRSTIMCDSFKYYFYMRQLIYFFVERVKTLYVILYKFLFTIWCLKKFNVIIKCLLFTSSWYHKPLAAGARWVWSKLPIREIKWKPIYNSCWVILLNEFKKYRRGTWRLIATILSTTQLWAEDCSHRYAALFVFTTLIHFHYCIQGKNRS